MIRGMLTTKVKQGEGSNSAVHIGSDASIREERRP